MAERKWKWEVPGKFGVYGAVLVQETAVAFGMYDVGATPHVIVLVAGGLGVVSCEIAMRLFGWGKRDGGAGGGFGLPPAVAA